MEINIWIVLSILAIHWFADFVCQTSWQAENKSKSWKALISHTQFYSFIWLVAGSIYLYLKYGSFSPPREECLNVLYFTLITFVLHTVTDYFTSRLNKILWEKKEVHNFFVSVGFDQLLHYIQLILTFYYLTKP